MNAISGFDRGTPLSALVSIAAAALVAGCGGGGDDGGSSATAPVPVYEQQRIAIAEVWTHCSFSCFLTPTVFLDGDGEATVFWLQAGEQPGWQVAVNQRDSLTVRSRLQVLGDDKALLQPVPLGGKRFAAIRTDTTPRTSALVDLSVPATPSVSARVTTPLDHTAQLVSGLDGAFAFGPHLASGDMSVGRNATIRTVHRPLPDGLVNLWWGTGEDAVGVVPTALWAFNAAKQDTSRQSVFFTRVDLGTGSVGEVTEIPGWYNPIAYVDQCTPVFSRDMLAVKPYDRGRVVVGWVNNKADAPRGCDVLVDGVVMNTPGSSGSGLPALGGTQAGPVAVWQQWDNDVLARVMWRQRDLSTGTWSAPTALSGHGSAYLLGSATSPSGQLAVAWSGCITPQLEGSCTAYVSKYERGGWTTSQFAALGERASHVSMAINWQGQAIVVWTGDQGGCSSDRTRRCPQVSAYRF